VYSDTAPRPTTRKPPPAWDVVWETRLRPEDHAAVHDLLAASYGPTTFAPGRSWVGARPELRVLGRVGDDVVAHAGIIRRFLRSPGGSLLVGDVGLVAVHPGRQGTGLGGALLAELRRTLVDLAVPHGFLTCDPDLRPFYERSGWVALPDTDLRAIGVHHQVEDDHRNGMVLPVRTSLDAWPAGPLERDGQEI
jgi:nodulation protein A